MDFLILSKLNFIIAKLNFTLKKLNFICAKSIGNGIYYSF